MTNQTKRKGEISLSYGITFGEAANMESMSAGEKEKLLVSFKSGTTYVVRVISPNDVAGVMMNGVYQCFNSVMAEPDDLYAKAQKVIYGYADEAKAVGDTEKEKEYKDLAKLLYPEKRFFRGFINLDTGKHIIIDLSNKQNNVILEAIKENKDELKDYAFKLQKTGSGQNTNVSLSIIVQKSKLTPTQAQNFEQTADAEFTKEMFVDAIPKATEAQRIEHLRKFEAKYGVSILSKLGIAGSSDEEHTPVDVNEEVLPF
jgi:hypothetical protein